MTVTKLLLTLIFTFGGLSTSLAESLQIQTSEAYSSKFWLWSNSMQVQIINPQTRASVLMYFTYDPLKQYLRTYEVTHLGKDALLEEIRHPSDFIKIRSFIKINTVEHIGLHAPRFGSLDENFVSRSVFGSPTDRTLARTVTMEPKELDVFLINTLIHRLFSNPDTYKNATSAAQTKTCKSYLN